MPEIVPRGRCAGMAQYGTYSPGLDGGVRHWSTIASRVATAKLDGVEPLAWLTDVLERVVVGRTKAKELAQLPLWAWKAEQLAVSVDAWAP